MPFKLLHFPYLVQEKIYKEMTYSELFLMSVLSTRAKKSIQRVRFNTDKLRYIFAANGKSLQVSRNHNCDRITSMKEFPHLKKRDTCLVKFGDLEVRTKFRLYESEGVTCNQMKVKYLDKEHQRAFQKYINCLFGYSKSNELHLNLDGDQMSVIDNISDTIVDGDTVEMSDLEEYFEKNPNQKSVYIQAKMNGELLKNSKLFGIENILIDNSNEFSASILRNFTGRHLVFLGGAIFKTTDIIEFVRKWINNEAYQKLETVWIKMETEKSDIDMFGVQENLPVIEYNPLTRPPKYIYNPKIIDYGHGEINVGGYTYFDVVRKGDGKKASFKIIPMQFIFLVWNS
ncbi:hypothetical protein CRE_13381 [Caenorhabditis remanei]|uniref:F-box domain-containing protein n=1 Tax=Caenorhabditis remanei TaxID=31234 RepID=E3M8I2_CAERE|nr:hypothetical protein CRE_13381 [Caenorhabditis remanei]